MTQSSEVYIILFHNALQCVKVIEKGFDSSVQITVQLRNPMYVTARGRVQVWRHILTSCCTQAPKPVEKIVREKA